MKNFLFIMMLLTAWHASAPNVSASSSKTGDFKESEPSEITYFDKPPIIKHVITECDFGMGDIGQVTWTAPLITVPFNMNYTFPINNDNPFKEALPISLNVPIKKAGPLKVECSFKSGCDIIEMMKRSDLTFKYTLPLEVRTSGKMTLQFSKFITLPVVGPINYLTIPNISEESFLTEASCEVLAPKLPLNEAGDPTLKANAVFDLDLVATTYAPQKALNAFFSNQPSPLPKLHEILFINFGLSRKNFELFIEPEKL